MAGPEEKQHQMCREGKELKMPHSVPAQPGQAVRILPVSMKLRMQSVMETFTFWMLNSCLRELKNPSRANLVAE